MRNKIICLTALLFLAIIPGCKKKDEPVQGNAVQSQQTEKTNLDMARKHGLLGEIPVYRAEKNPDGAKVIVSPYFSSTDGEKTNFSIETKFGEVVTVEYPSQAIRVIRDASKKVPTVELIFKKDWLEKNLDWRMTESDTYEDVWKTKGPTSFAYYYYIETIIVRISPETLKNEMAFAF